MTTTQNSIANPIEASSDWLLTIPRLSQNQSVLVSPNGTGMATSYSLVYDVYFLKNGSTGWMPFLQTDTTNLSDGDIFGKASGDSYGVGIGGNYRGAAKLDAWNRIGLTIETGANGTVSMNKYINGEFVANQKIDGGASRFAIDMAKGFLIFSDENGETSPGYLSNFLFLKKVLTSEEMSYLGEAKASGILPVAMKSEAEKVGVLEVGFAQGSATPVMGSGKVTGNGTPLEFKTPAQAGILAIGEKPAVDPIAVVKTSAIKDMMVTPDAANVTIDLSKHFSGEKLTFTVQNSKNETVNVVLKDGNKLVLDFAALGHSDIRVTATDSAGKSIADDFRVRVAGPNAYTIAVFPDTQDYTSNDGIKHLFGEMTQWLVDNRDSHKIVFMSHVGDITQNNRPAEWDVAEPALRKLDGKVPYALLPGNHDQANGGTAADHSSVELDRRFSAEKQAATNAGVFGGAYDQEQAAARNTYSTFTAPDGTKWLSISLEFGPRDDVIRWAGDVIEKFPDHRVMLATHSLTSYATRQDNLALPLYDEGAGYDYGMRTDQRGANDGEYVARALLSRYPNIVMTFSGHIFGDGAETDITYNQYGEPVFQFLVNYQNGVSREITGNGVESRGNNGGNGAMRLITIDPDNNRITTETYFTAFDDYLDGYRTKPELDRDGLTGYYRGHQEVFENVYVGKGKARAMAEAGDDILADAAAGASSASVALSGAKSLLTSEIQSFVWSDRNGDIVAEGKEAVADLALGKHKLTLTATDVNGIKTSDTVDVLVRGDRTLLVENFNDGKAEGWATDFGAADGNTGRFLLKGTVFSRPTSTGGLAAPEAALFDQSDAADNKLVYIGAQSAIWSDYVFEATLTQLDNDAMGVYFYYKDANNYYRFAMDGETNRRQLVKVADGKAVLLAEVNEGTPYNMEIPLTVAVVGGTINVFLGDKNVFGGPVVDATAPLSGGTVGVYSSGQRISVFDDIVVTRAVTTAKAGIDQRAYDIDGDGKAFVTLDASGSFGPEQLTGFVWTDLKGNVVATGKKVDVALNAGVNKLLLKVTAANGSVSTDRIDVTVVDRTKILVAEDFSSAEAMARFKIVDEGEFGGIGPDGKASEWLISNGKLLQTTELASRELTWSGATNPDYYKRGWSPMGDGVNVLRLGTYALFNDPAALAWTDYAIETTFQTPDKDGLGFLFRYRDSKNYYKLELDADGILDRRPSNGAGSIFNLVRMKNGIEEILAQVPGKYEPGQAMKMRVEVAGDKISALLNDEALFAYPIGDRELDAGTFGLYSWGNAGLTFDNLTVVDLKSGLDTGKTLTGTSGHDMLTGTASDEIIFGFDGNDELQGAGGNDRLDGGRGDDALAGGEGNDALSGDVGDDSLWGEDGNDIISGGFGDDFIEGGRGNDLLIGGDGSDRYRYGRGDGSDDIVEVASASSTTDRLTLYDIARSEAVLRKYGQSVEIELADGAKLSLRNQLADGGIERLSFADGVVLDRNDIVKALVNRGPAAVDDRLAAVNEDALSFVISFATLLGNDRDADLDGLTVTGVSASVGGTAVLENTGIRFTLSADFNGEAAFRYQIADGRGGSSEASATFAVKPVNDAPEVSPVTVETDEDKAVSGKVVASDIDGDKLSFALKAGATNGVARIDAETGDWTYTPAENVNGTGSFIVLVSDGKGGISESTVNVTIKPVNDAPVAVADMVAVREKDKGAFDLVANDTDVEGDRLALVGVSVTAVAGVALTNEQAAAAFSVVDGKLVVDPSTAFATLEDDQQATVTLTYTVRDANGGESTGVTTVTVDGYTEYNIVEGSNGDDVLIGTSRKDMLEGGSGDDRLSAGEGHDIVDAGEGHDRVIAGEGSDDVYGGAGNDVLMGGAGNDVVFGGAGNDEISGGSGHDVLAGGSGNDVLTGGSGVDIFVFAAGDGRDVVTDFQAGLDIVQLSKDVFADYQALIASGAFTDGANGAEIAFKDGSTITFDGVKTEQFVIDDFRFA
ncbi:MULTISPECIES: Ig-like domain-containing protein [Rhizobium/Agrobacterium group]|uniref:Ig-like domain-containing protein n=1 Tax=Rhizobium/Agrobacterium group TaxID=227290 RepID=UPI001436B092|nr:MULTISPECIES: Ig-like domain-containing protein [Rhizobium/Agrobacterium group]MBB4403782.1 3',5'-cyclic AMP phosphodiesterase CpdA/Ca2+-binding RTX toxin-like protein [Agrobacterium radiobacter]MBB5589935.1 3',5'-cyclic AMP phosphodiesterase CpdA/Ca2+-binding RTX toxin-like protein [Agrobacterium radiobacter]